MKKEGRGDTRGKFVACYRVSTDKQGKSGVGLAAQRKAVRDYLDGGNWQLLGEYTEVESGKRSDRPDLEKAIALPGSIGRGTILQHGALNGAILRRKLESWFMSSFSGG